MEVSARLDIAVYCDCPHCGYFINLLDERDTSGECLNDEGQILSQACPDGYWIDEHVKFNVQEVTCTKCNGVFDVKGLEW